MGTSKKGAVGTARAARGDRRTKYKDIYLGNARVTENKKNAIVKPQLAVLT